MHLWLFDVAVHDQAFTHTFSLRLTTNPYLIFAIYFCCLHFLQHIFAFIFFEINHILKLLIRFLQIFYFPHSLSSLEFSKYY